MKAVFEAPQKIIEADPEMIDFLHQVAACGAFLMLSIFHAVLHSKDIAFFKKTVEALINEADYDPSSDTASRREQVLGIIAAHAIAVGEGYAKDDQRDDFTKSFLRRVFAVINGEGAC